MLASSLSLGSSIAGTAGNILMQQDTNKQNERLQDKANAHNIKLWNMQNQYNLPINQMDRLRQAGLNPNLMYGLPSSQAQMAHQADTSGKAVAPQIDPLTLANVQLMKAQSEKTQTEAELLKQELPYKPESLHLDIEGKKLSNIAQDIQNKINSETSQEQINTIKQQFNVTENQANMLYQQALVLSLEHDLREQGLKMKQIDNIMYQSFKDEELKEIRNRNKILGIDADNYQKLFGDTEGKSNEFKQIATIIQMILGGYKSIK